jgi:DNA replication protein DnaC
MTTQEQTIVRLRGLKLSAMADHYDIQLSQPQISHLGFDERFSLLVDAEISTRENRRLKRLVSSASLPEAASLEDFDPRPGRGIEKDFLATMGSCEWIRRQQNLVVVGPTGVGKTWLGAALVTQACRLSITAKWYRTSDLLEQIAEAAADGSLAKFKRTLAKPNLLALDDFGLGVLNENASSVLLDVVDRRLRGGGSLLITSQLPIANWHSLFPEPSVADAILDRIVHQAHVLSLKGESMRKRRASLGDSLNAA